MFEETGVDELTRNEGLVLDALKASPAPLKAYDILDQLKSLGVRAPMTVYRALDGLQSKGRVHKIEALNAFAPCNISGPHIVQTFLVCDACGGAEETPAVGSEADLAALAEALNFEVRAARLEVQGRCAECQAAAE